jgi:protein phosphatase
VSAATTADDTLDITLARRFAVESHGRSDPGRVRPNNEDQFLVAELAKAMHVLQSSFPEPTTRIGSVRGHLFLVADGVGGHAAGETASRAAALTVEEVVLDALKWFTHLRGPEGEVAADDLREAVRRADERLLAEAEQRPELRGMATTLTMALEVGGDLFVAHVGDSRTCCTRVGCTA